VISCEQQGCAARNVHGFTVDDVNKMAADWEEAPPLYLRLDIHVCFLIVFI
jgi:YLP motif-containing protein 1